jgi:hypothetical protein
MQPTTSFQTLKRSTIRITDMNTDRVWDIRDDTPMSIIVQYIDIQIQMSKFKDITEIARNDPAEAKAMVLAADDASAAYLLAIFQFSYPETTMDEILTHFSYEDRQELCQLFFTLRTQRSSTQLARTPQTAAGNGASKPATTATRSHHKR